MCGKSGLKWCCYSGVPQKVLRKTTHIQKVRNDVVCDESLSDVY